MLDNDKYYEAKLIQGMEFYIHSIEEYILKHDLPQTQFQKLAKLAIRFNNLIDFEYRWMEENNGRMAILDILYNRNNNTNNSND